VERLDRLLVETALDLDRGVVDEDVDAPEVVLDLRGDLGHSGFVGHVADHEVNLSARRLDGVGELREGLASALLQHVEADHGGAFRRVARGDGLADAPRRPRHDRHPAVEPAHRHSFACPRTACPLTRPSPSMPLTVAMPSYAT
jgi:hypothetical protein